MPPRIAITGIGVVSTFGLGRQVYWDHVRAGISGTRAITAFDAASFPCRVAADVPPLPDDPVVLANENGHRASRADPKRYSRAADFAVRAAREAWQDAGLGFGEPRAGVIIGSGGGGIDVGERQMRTSSRRAAATSRRTPSPWASAAWCRARCPSRWASTA
ncbi:MAG: beta-ketoacyl synthase N-terminal-like domain-containing protein [Vicinamibacterales bacterium]